MTRVDDAVKKVESVLSETNESESEVLSEKVLCAQEELLKQSKDVMFEWLDAQHGSAVTQLSVFEKLAKKYVLLGEKLLSFLFLKARLIVCSASFLFRYENEFLNDMKQLNVLPPDVLVRVSEYIPEIIEYIKKIVENGYGYVAKDGSVCNIFKLLSSDYIAFWEIQV